MCASVSVPDSFTLSKRQVSAILTAQYCTYRAHNQFEFHARLSVYKSLENIPTDTRTCTFRRCTYDSAAHLWIDKIIFCAFKVHFAFSSCACVWVREWLHLLRNHSLFLSSTRRMIAHYYVQLPRYVIFSTSSTSLSTATCTCNYDAKNGLYCVGAIRDAVSRA